MHNENIKNVFFSNAKKLFYNEKCLQFCQLYDVKLQLEVYRNTRPKN